MDKHVMEFVAHHICDEYLIYRIFKNLRCICAFLDIKTYDGLHVSL